MRYDLRSSSQAVALLHPSTSFFSMALLWPASSREGSTTCSSKSSRDSSLTGASLKNYFVSNIDRSSLQTKSFSRVSEITLNSQKHSFPCEVIKFRSCFTKDTRDYYSYELINSKIHFQNHLCEGVKSNKLEELRF